MNIIKRTAIAMMSLVVMTTAFTGCSMNEKSGAEEASVNFLAALQSGDENSINEYSSSQVAQGSFVKLFSTEALKEQFRVGFVQTDMDEDTLDKLDEFCDMFDSLITKYEVNEVTIDNNGVATAVCTLETKFPTDIIGSDEASDLINQVTEIYYTSHQEEVLAMIADEGEEAATRKIYNDMTKEVLDVYERLIQEAGAETYAIALTLEKNAETGSWYVTNVQDFDSSINGTIVPATDTATTELSTVDADAALESASTGASEN